jgi:hypothetical protein
VHECRQHHLHGIPCSEHDAVQKLLLALQPLIIAAATSVGMSTMPAGAFSCITPTRRRSIGRSLEEALAWCLVWLMAPEIGIGQLVM